MIVYGFTGTQIGWSAKQYDAFQDRIWDISSVAPEDFCLHHGDCIGSDANAHEVVFEMGWNIVVHPPTVEDKRAFVHRTKFWDDERCTLLDPFPYLDRNKHIVSAATAELLATPQDKQERLRSGTWATVRAAKRLNLPVRLFHRDGSVDLQPPRENR